MTNKHSAVNWNEEQDPYTQMFWKQNIMQFWIDEEIPVSQDKNVWMELAKNEQETYKKVLAGLTLLDTKQGGEGMPLISLHIENLQQKALLTFMAGMEQIHAKSYSTIFTTIASNEEIQKLFLWTEENEYLQKKAEMISNQYINLWQPKVSKEVLFQALVASVFLESFLFYSGFFYPLFLAGQGKMTNSGEIINLIIRDESIHGVYVGLLAQSIYQSFSTEKQSEMFAWTQNFLDALMKNEKKYTKQLYDAIGLTDEVNAFLIYNANKSMMNLGFEPIYDAVEINPIIENGLQTNTKTHDFFSQKGNGYIKVIYVEPLQDEDFIF